MLNAGQMDGEAGWWITSVRIGLSQLARVMGMGRHYVECLAVNPNYISDVDAVGV